jgi:hypothetical protein
MRAFLVVGAALALSACGGGGSETQSGEANMATDNMMMEGNMAMDPMMNGSANMGMDPMMNGTMNGTMNGVDPATQNMIQQDMNTNSPDTNLANGM